MRRPAWTGTPGGTPCWRSSTEHGRVSVEEAAERLEVSQATIRRDFDQLAQQQMITRTRGGAVANGVSYDLPLRYKTAKHSAEKQRIGAAAAALVSPGTVVGLNGGTTITEVARALAMRPDLTAGAEGGQLTVVTNALNIANELLVRVPDEDRGGRRRGPPAVLRAGRPAGWRTCARSPSTSPCSASTPSTSSWARRRTTRARRR